MSNYDQAVKKINKIANETAIVSKNYHDVLAGDDSKDITLSDGTVTPTLGKRVKQLIMENPDFNNQEKEDRFIITESGRTQREKNKEVGSILDFNQQKNINSAIENMASSLGYIRIPPGVYEVDSCNIEVPVYFDDGASIFTSGTINIKNSIHSSRQYIFKGEGTYNLGATGIAPSGEDARDIHASWFGVIGGLGDVTSKIQKACNAVGNVREATILFDTTNYIVSGEIKVNRCTKIKGTGTRRTVFRLMDHTNTSDIFVTNNEGCTFEGIQFECVGGTKISGHWIRANHDNTKIIDVRAGGANQGIQINGDSCEVKGIAGAYGHETELDSYLINVANGSANDIQDVQILKTGYSSTHTVLLGGQAQTKTISGAKVDNVKTQAKLTVMPKSGLSIARCSIKNIFGLSSTVQFSELVEVNVNGGNIVELNVTDLTATAKYNSIATIKQPSGQLVRCIFDNMSATNDTTVSNQSIVNYTYTSGTTAGNQFKAGLAATNRPNILSVSGLTKTADIWIAPEIHKKNQTLCGKLSIASNTAQIVTIFKDLSMALISVMAKTTISADYAVAQIRAFTSPSASILINNENSIIVFSTDANQQDAENGKLTVSANSDGSVVFINKSSHLVSIVYDLAS